MSAPLLLAGTDDNTFVYGFLRDFLLLRNDLRIEAGIVVISCDCREVASEQEIQRVGSLLKKLGVPAVISENSSAVDICHKYVLKATAIYAGAYNSDPEFYSFMKTLETYRETIDENTILMLTTESDYLKYLKRIK